jgi:3-phosphoshikimate 1-carboxyvinyltransferase
MDLEIHSSKGLHGKVLVPGDKSISHRALLIGALAEGVTTIEHLSPAADVGSTLGCLKALGVEVDVVGSQTRMHGKGPRGFLKPTAPLNAGNSGTTMRLLSGILAGQRFDSMIIGDSSLSRRPMRRIIDPLRLMGAQISATPEFTPPISISSTYKLRPIDYELSVPSAQVKSAILFAGLYADGVTRVTESLPTRDHTEKMLGLKVHAEGSKRTTEIRGGLKILPRTFVVPGDISGAAFLIAAGAIVPNSEIVVQNVGLNKSRTAVLDVMQAMNVALTVQNEKVVEGEPIGDILVKTSDIRSDVVLAGSVIPMLIDEIPMLAVLALFGHGSFTVKDAGELRFKETDRINAIVQNMRALGVEIEERADGFAINAKNTVIGCELESYRDHRIAMAFGVVGLRVPGIVIRNAECADISCPDFWKTIQDL